MNDFDAASGINSLITLLKLKDTALAQMIEARIFVEEKTALLAAERADSEEMRKLESLLEKMAHCVTHPERFAPLDTQFHQQIAICAHNPILQKFIAIISDLVRAQHIEIAHMPKVSTISHEYHAKIFQFIAAGDGAAAAAVMREHIAQAFARLKNASDELGGS